MSSCSNSVNKYIVVEPSTEGTFSGLTVCGGGGITVDFITGCTVDGVQIEGTQFQGNTLTVPSIYATLISGGTLYGDGSNLDGVVDSYMTGGTYATGFITFEGNNNFSDVVVDVSALLDNTNTYVSGGTYNVGTKEINFVGNSIDTTFDVDLTSLVSSVSGDTFVTEGSYSPTTDIITLTRNDAVTIDITGVTDNYVLAGTYIDSTDTISLLRQDGSFVNITGVTDTFTTGATYDNGTTSATFTKNDGTSFTLDLSSSNTAIIGL